MSHQLQKVGINREKEIMEIQNNQKAIDKMTVISPFISILILNVNELNSPIKRHKMAE